MPDAAVQITHQRSACQTGCFQEIPTAWRSHRVTAACLRFHLGKLVSMIAYTVDFETSPVQVCPKRDDSCRTSGQLPILDRRDGTWRGLSRLRLVFLT